MTLALFDRVQENTTTTGTGSVTLDGAVSGFQTFAVVGNGNNCYYTITDGSAWEVGIGTYSTTGPTLARTTILSNSNGNTSPITLSAGTKAVFLTYPAEKAVYVDDGTTVVLPGGMKINGTLETNSNPYVGGSYGGNQFYPTNGGGARVNSLYDGVVTVNVGTTGTIDKTSTFDVNGNLLTNSVTQSLAMVTAAAGTTTLTPASPHFQILVGTGVQTFKLPDATILATGSSWIFDNDSTGNLTVTDNAGATLDIVAPGGYSTVFLEANGTAGGTWGKYGMLPSEVNWGTNSLDLGGSTVITNGLWNGTPIAYNYGGTGLTTFAGANNALYSTSASTLTAGTLPAAAGGTGLTSFTANGVVYASSTSALTTGSALTFDGTNLRTTGSVILANNKGYYIKNASAVDQQVLTLGSDDSVYFGQVTSPTAGNLYLYGNSQVFVAGGAEQMRLTSSTLSLVNNPTLSAGTANGVTYLNGSKVLTSGSALTFDGTTLTNNAGVLKLDNYGAAAGKGLINFGSSGPATIEGFDAGNGGSGAYLKFGINGELMRLTSSTLSLVNNPTLSAGTANGVAYLDGGKVLTTGSALTFESGSLYVKNGGLLNSLSPDGSVQGWLSAANSGQIDIAAYNGAGTAYLAFKAGTATEGMRLTSTGLGIGTSAPLYKLDVNQDQATTTWSRVRNSDSTASAYAGVVVNAYGNSWGMRMGSAAANSNTLQFVVDAVGSPAAKLSLTTAGAGTATADWTFNGVTVGRGAGDVATNTAVGASALAANTSGLANAAFSQNALFSNTTGNYNTAVGRNTLYTNTSGSYNTAVGVEPLYYNTTGAYNVGIGFQALLSNTTASNNTAVGFQAGYSNTTGQYNVALGYLSLYSNTTADQNTALGYETLRANTTGAYNSASGFRALYSNTTGNANVAQGFDALRSNTTASNNTAVGYQAGYSNQTGEVQAFGNQALYSNTTGNNTAVGDSALYSATTGTANTAMGYAAALLNTGSANTAIGHQALRLNTTASNNTAVGYQAGYSNQTGANLVALGVTAGYNSTAANNTFLGAGAGYSTTTGGGNTLVGAIAGYALTTGQGNTFIGGAIDGVTDASGRFVTTGSKNTIIGSFSGNQGGLDIRTANNYIVLSDGDGNPRGVFDSSGILNVGSTTVGAIASSRINPRSSTTTSTATLAPDIQAYDQYNLTAQAVALAISAPIGTPVDGNKIMFRILDNGTARAITWNATYTVVGVTLPATTVVNKTTYVGCIYNANNTRWDVVAVVTQA